MTNNTQPYRQQRIVLVSHYFPAHVGGIEHVAWEIATRWLADGNTQIDWFASDTDPAPELAGLSAHPVSTWNGIERRYGIPIPLWTAGVLPALWRAISHADLVHIHDSLYMGNIMAALLAKLLNKPLILTQHIGFFPYKSIFLRTVQAIANRTVTRLIMALSREVVFISPVVEQYFRTLWHWQSTAHIIPNGVDTELFYPPSATLREQAKNALGLSATKPVWLFAGRFVEKKGLPILRQMAESTPDADWIFVGHGPLDPKAWNLANVKVFSGLSKESLRSCYWAADLLVLPSVGEGFPLVVQEAMACGLLTLVACQTASSCPEGQALMLSETVDGENTVARWVNRLQTYKINDPEQAQLRAAAAAFAKSYWSWPQCVERYKSLVNNSQPAKPTPTD